MSPYRKRFMQFNMLLIGVVLTIMVAAVAVYIVNDSYHGLRVTMEQVVALLRGFSQPAKENQEPPSQRPERREERDILAVFYDPESEDYSVLSPTASFTDEEIKDILAAIAARTEDFGILHQNHAIYYRSGGTAPYRIAIASTSYITHSVVRLVLVLSAIWLLAMLLALGFLCGSLLSDKAVGGICGALLTNLCGWLSGTWFSLDLVGGIFKKIAYLLPFANAVDAGRAALSGNTAAVFPRLWLVLAWAGAVLLTSVLVFRHRMKLK